MNSHGHHPPVVDTRVIAELRRQLKGRVITPGDPVYEHARTIAYSVSDRRPAAIARVADAADVARVITLARQSGAEVAVRSGGHSPAGHSLSDGIVIDLRDLRALTIDAENRTAWAETGLTAGEYTAAAGVYSLATGFGDTPSVGIGGITLGGGVGYLSRKYGLTIDNLLAAEIISADGELLRADTKTNPDLFWALRGGGGNFGVATRFQYRLHPVSTAVGGMLILPATPETITAFVAEAQAAPPELSTILNIMNAPPMPFLPPEAHGKLILMANMIYAGEIEEGEHVVARFRKLAPPLADMLRSMRYPEIFLADEGDFHPSLLNRTMYLNQVDLDSAQAMLHYIAQSDAMMRIAQLRVLGGAVAGVPVDATAYAHRQATILANLVAIFTDEAERPVRQVWMDEFAAALPHRAEGLYVNFLGSAKADKISEIYPGKTGQRLAEIKRRYDPENFFHLNHNIQPL